MHKSDAFICIPVERLPNHLGPGKYNPKKLDRHVSSPTFGSKRYFANDEADVGRSDVVRPKSPEPRDHITIFHEYGEKMALDPNSRTTHTPGAIIGHESPHRQTTIHGVKKLAGGVTPNQDRGLLTRNEKASESYDVKYDSECVRPRIRLGDLIPKTPRFHEPNSSSNSPSRTQPHSNANSRPVTRESTRPESRAKTANLATLAPKKGLHLKFDDSCYNTSTSFVKKVVDRNPSAINRSVQSDLFFKLYAVPRAHWAPEMFPITKSRSGKFDTNFTRSG